MAGRRTKSSKEPKFLTPSMVEGEVDILLAEYAAKFGPVIQPPVPIDEIVEEYLKIAVEIKDLKSDYPEGDVLGAIWFAEKRIAIDESLVPEDYPSMRGRYRFTLAHELGHWRLHRYLYLGAANQKSLLPGDSPAPDHVKRSRDTDSKETQANIFAASLLMPREMVKRVWHEWRGNMDPIYLADLRVGPADPQVDQRIIEQSIRPMAEQFIVSPVAMSIRLKGLHLVLEKRERMLF